MLLLHAHLVLFALLFGAITNYLIEVCSRLLFTITLAGSPPLLTGTNDTDCVGVP